MIARGTLMRLLVAATMLLCAGPLAVSAHAEETANTPKWRLEQPLPPALSTGQSSSTPIGLGRIGDIKFWAPNRGVLITAGNPPTIPPGVWVYNGQEWHQLTGPGPHDEGLCGATDGRIAWAEENEFWTVSDGRPGQVTSEKGVPPLEDDTLCRFASGSSGAGEVVGSYASPAFEARSYTPMDAAGCLGGEDCWFAGRPVPHVGAFHLHWNGHQLTEEPNPQGRAVDSMSPFEGDLYEGVLIRPPEALGPGETREEEEHLTPPETGQTPAALHLILPAGQSSVAGTPFESLEPGVPIYGEEEPPWALEAVQFGGAPGSLWGVANPIPRSRFPSGSEQFASGEVTILRDTGGSWTQVLGATTDPPGGNPFTKFHARRSEPTAAEEQRENDENLLATSIAPEPDSESAWLAVHTTGELTGANPAFATLAHVSAQGEVAEEQRLPAPEEKLGQKGAADVVTCPAVNDCWMATAEGWLFHYAPADERQISKDSDQVFEHLITFRPHDQGVPQVIPDSVPGETLAPERTAPPPPLVTAVVENEAKVPVPLLSQLHSRLIHGHTLELSFHLAVKASLRLIAMRKKAVVASTKTKTFASGNRKLLLGLNPKRWPTKLDLQTHALAPLPLTTTRSPSVNTVTTSLAFPNARGLLGPGLFAGLLP